MSEKIYQVLFLCTANSARSILAECILNRVGRGRLEAYSAGSHPGGTVNPLALALLEERSFDTSGLRSKSWDEFTAPGAPELDFVVTVCDNAAAEVCPVWPGGPVSAHWGIPDPAAATGSTAERSRAFADAFRRLEDRLSAFADLPLDSLDPQTLRQRLAEIGNMGD